MTRDLEWREKKIQEKWDKRKKEKERKFKAFDKGKHLSNYDSLNMFLLKCNKYIEWLDSGGWTIWSIFMNDPESWRLNFWNFIVGLEIWGSFSPINPWVIDIQTTRSTAYLKLKWLRKNFQNILDEFAEEEGDCFSKMITTLKIIEFYF